MEYAQISSLADKTDGCYLEKWDGNGGGSGRPVEDIGAAFAELSNGGFIPVSETFFYKPKT